MSNTKKSITERVKRFFSIQSFVNTPWDTLLDENNRYLDLACEAVCLFAAGYFFIWILISYATR